ncbi:unnamed protein product [Thelazia callipaeda]|uniref:CLP1_P domain-containing protein n=1 Tax=Thelazia callipaeda TaxID=103827 RepID=A0A0N5CYB7_THECL|nr:unnamed protein product [Thelazia callipaeda]
MVLFGKVLSKGYEFEAGAYAKERFIKVAAPYSVGPPAQFVSCMGKPPNRYRIKWRVKEITDSVDSVLDIFEEGDSLLLFQFNFSKICACFRELHGQIFFLPPDSKDCLSIGPLCTALLTEYPPLYKGTTANNIAELVNRIFKRYSEGKRSIVMVIGSKNTGKSMLTRLLANSFIGSNHPAVYILDCDVGQPEMSPPGCISLIKLSSPLLGVPIFHQRIVLLDTYFYGDITINCDSDLYLDILRKLLKRFQDCSPSSSVLLINTCGWVEGKGVSLLDRMLKLFDPDFVFNFVTPAGPNYEVCQVTANGSKKPAVFCAAAVEKFMHLHSSPSMLRSLRLTSYMLHACPSPTIKSFADATPFAVSFRDIALLVNSNELFPDTHIFAVLNCTLVALCVRDDVTDLMNRERLFNNKDMPVLLNPRDREPLLVVGYGFIRAIDLEQYIFYIITPLELSTCQKVNVLARGLNIDLPQCFFVSQRKAAVPYVVRERSSTFHSELFKKLKTKSSFHRKRFLKSQNQVVVQKVKK